MSTRSNLPSNRLLSALPLSNFKRIAPHLETITCEREQILIEANSPLDHIFFPDSGVVSMMALYSDGSVIELATIGREGFAGVRAVFGTKKSAARYLVQIPGSAAKMSRAAFTRALKSMPSFRTLMYSYVQAFLDQVLVVGACNGTHSLKEESARPSKWRSLLGMQWLSLDVSGTMEFLSWETGNRVGKRGNRMSILFFILAMGPMAALGIYNPPAVHHSPARCIAEPGSIDALYCSGATAETPTRHPRHKR